MAISEEKPLTIGAVCKELKAEFDIFQGARNPPGAGMPARWFVVYGRK